MRISVAALAGALCVADAHAGFTSISSALSDAGGSDFTHADILGGLYGGSFTGSGLDFTSGSITATRIHDFDSGDGQSGALNLVGTSGAGMNDQMWVDGLSELGARTRYSSAAGTSFGYFQGGDNPTSGLTGGAMISGTGDPMFGLGTSYGLTDISGAWRWGLESTNGVSSMIGDNADGGDHMITYMITGEGLTSLGYDADATVWLLFWDAAEEGGADSDFNDYVVELVASAVAVPLPTPIALAGIGLLGIVLGRRRLSKTLR